MVDRREHADHEQSDPDLQRRLGKSGRDRGDPDADEEHDHHAFAAPSIGEPARRIRENSEREEAGRRIFEKIAVAQVPLACQRQRRHGREDQREQMIEKVPDIQEQEMRAVAIHRSSHLGPRVGVPAVRPKIALAFLLRHAKDHRDSDKGQQMPVRAAPVVRRPQHRPARLPARGAAVRRHGQELHRRLRDRAAQSPARPAHLCGVRPDARAHRAQRLDRAAGPRRLFAGAHDPFDQHARRCRNAHALHRARRRGGSVFRRSGLRFAAENASAQRYSAGRPRP